MRRNEEEARDVPVLVEDVEEQVGHAEFVYCEVVPNTYEELLEVDHETLLTVVDLEQHRVKKVEGQAVVLKEELEIDQVELLVLMLGVLDEDTIHLVGGDCEVLDGHEHIEALAFDLVVPFPASRGKNAHCGYIAGWDGGGEGREKRRRASINNRGSGYEIKRERSI